MNKAGILVLGAMLTVGASLFTTMGCSSGSGTGGGGGTGTGGASSTSTSSKSSSASTSTSTSTSGSSSSSGMMATLDCKSYCNTIATSCKDPAATQQYADPAECMNVCANFPPGKLSDTSGNTLGCRLYHATVAGMSAMNATTHCNHAGPLGGANSGAMADDGPCGNGCEAFCQSAVKICPTQEKDMASCMTECKTFAKDANPYSVADTDKNDLGCRMYHLSVAAKDAASATTHCPHIVAASAVCTK